MCDLPPPLVDVDCDLRDFTFMPMDIVRLFNSRFHAIANDSEWRAGVTLWLKSFHQLPAGSVPDDDIELCRLAELGRDLKQWRKLKTNAMHGWVKCSDGRFYHPVVCEKAREGWQRKQKQRDRSRKGNEARWGDRRTNAAPDIPDASLKDASSIPKGLPEGLPIDPKGQGQVQGQGEKPPYPHDGNEAGTIGNPPMPERFRVPGVEWREDDRGWHAVVNGWYLDTTWERVAETAGLDAEGWKGDISPMVEWLRDDIPLETIEAAVRRCASRASYEKPRTLRYFDPAVREEWKRAA